MRTKASTGESLDVLKAVKMIDFGRLVREFGRSTTGLVEGCGGFLSLEVDDRKLLGIDALLRGVVWTERSEVGGRDWGREFDGEVERGWGELMVNTYGEIDRNNKGFEKGKGNFWGGES